MRFRWLKDYQALDEQILYLKWNLNKSKLELSRWVSGDLVKVRLEKSSRASSLEENIEAIFQSMHPIKDATKDLWLKNFT